MDPEHVAWITDRILNILKYLHYHGVVHGDVKPGNIIIQPDSHMVVLVDYGLSLIRPVASTTNKGYTPAFAPPEQVDGRTLIPESDFYSLGMTIISALGGSVGEKRVPAKTPKGMCEFVRKMIRFNVIERPNWQEDLCETFKAIRRQDFGRDFSGMKPLNF